MRFHVCVGVLPHEREHAQPLEIDVTVRVDDDALVDYRELHARVSTRVNGEVLELLETLADEIANDLLAIGHVRWCRVAVRKPGVALPGPLAYAQVAVEHGHAD